MAGEHRWPQMQGNSPCRTRSHCHPAAAIELVQTGADQAAATEKQ